MRKNALKTAVFLCFCIAASGPALMAADFEMAPESSRSDAGSKGTSGRSAGSLFPTLIDAGDVPTAYPLAKYEFRTDIRFYGGGGIMTKAYLGIFKRFWLGGGLNVRNLIGTGDVTMAREDAQFLCRVLVLSEDRNAPAVSLGWDGPSYELKETRGLYAVASKEISSPLGFFQLHGCLSNADFEQFEPGKDLRGSLAITTIVYQVALFAEADEIFHPLGPMYNAGLRMHFDPITLGVEFRDLSSSRTAGQVARMLRINYTGLF